MLMEAPGFLELMPFAGAETESDNDGEEGETFHRAPLSHCAAKRNPRFTESTG